MHTVVLSVDMAGNSSHYECVTCYCFEIRCQLVMRTIRYLLSAVTRKTDQSTPTLSAIACSKISSDLFLQSAAPSMAHMIDSTLGRMWNSDSLTTSMALGFVAFILNGVKSVFFAELLTTVIMRVFCGLTLAAMEKSGDECAWRVMSKKLAFVSSAFVETSRQPTFMSAPIVKSTSPLSNTFSMAISCAVWKILTKFNAVAGSFPFALHSAIDLSS